MKIELRKQIALIGAFAVHFPASAPAAVPAAISFATFAGLRRKNRPWLQSSKIE